MDENPLLNYNLFDGFRNVPNVDDIVRIVLDEQKHSLTEDDRRILRDRENLQNEIHTLQNANPFPSKESNLSTSWYKTGKTESLNSSKFDDVYFVDVEAIEYSSLTTLENTETGSAELDNTIANFIQDENIKAEVFRLNHQIRINSASIRALSSDAKNLVTVKLNLQRKLVNIEKKIASFSVEEMRVKRIKRKKGTDCANTGHKKRTYFYRFGAPYFKTKERFPADCNSDLMQIIRTNQPMSIRLPRLKRFLPHDAAYLENSILKQLKAKRVEQLQKCLKQAKNRFKNDRDNEALAEEVRHIVRTVKEAEEISHISATKDWNIPVDFMALSQSARFTGEDYERIWRLTGSPSLSRAEFSENEYSELKLLAEKYNRQDWDKIASEMSTKRSGFMCFTKYMATEKKGKNKPWTKEENELLHNLCISMDFVSKSDSRYQFWKTIRSYFPHRTYTQVHSHWTYVLEPRLKKGRFTPDENCLMLKLFNEGKSYKEIARLVQNRTCIQIRTHFEAMMQKQINRGNWTPEEEEKLLQLIEKYGTHNWVMISKELGTRNRSQCRLKYMLYEKNNQRFSLGTRAPKDFWTQEENEQFKELLRRYGTDFTKMSQEMKTKDRNQLRYKYHRTKVKAEFMDLVSPWEKLRKDRKDKCSWTNEELERYKQLLIQYGTQYKVISSLMGKTPLQLRYKYYSMRNEWNLPLPSMGKSCRDVSESFLKSGENKYKNTSSVSLASSPVPVTYATDLPVVEKCEIVSENLFKNLTPVSSSSDISVTSLETCNGPPASTSNPLSTSSEWKEKITTSLTEPLYHDTSLLQSLKTRTVWIKEESEQFKLLLMKYGPQYKKISSIMKNKSIKQLRWKHYSMKCKGDLPPITAANVESKKCEKPLLLQKVEKSSNHSPIIISAASVMQTKPCNIFSDHAAVEDDFSQKEEMLSAKSSTLKSVWTDEELETFNRLLMEHGPQFEKISKMIPGKSLNQLRYKYNFIKKSEKSKSSKRATVASMPVPITLSAELSSKHPLPTGIFENIATIPSLKQKLSQPLFLTPEEHTVLTSDSSSLSVYADSEDGFIGFPNKNQESSLSYVDLIPHQRIETVEHAKHFISLPEQMIVPEKISEMCELSDVNQNECSLSADSLNINLSCKSVSSHVEMDFDSFNNEVVEVKRESNEIKEEIWD